MPGTIVIGLIFAATHFIVPVEGQTTDRKWEATLVVTNAGTEPITLTVDAIYPLMGTIPCAPANPVPIPAHQSQFIYATTFCSGESIHAFSFTADGPVIPVLDVSAYPSCGAPQNVRVENDWYPAGSQVAITRINFIPPQKRANLLLVNPNPQPVEFTYWRIVQGPSPRHTVFVSGDSLVIEPLLAPELFCFDSGTDFLPDPTCGIVVTAPARFYAGASVINNDSNAAIYRSGTLVSMP